MRLEEKRRKGGDGREEGRDARAGRKAGGEKGRKKEEEGEKGEPEITLGRLRGLFGMLKIEP